MVSVTAEQRVPVPLLSAAWNTMTFVHWRVEPERIQALLPDGLTVDVYDNAAWLGLTPFVMSNMRPFGLPHLPRVSFLRGPRPTTAPSALTSTPETNLRTYVRGPDGRDGLWFLAIDAGSGVLAAAVRGAVGAPYRRARMSVQVDGDTVTYAGSRPGTRDHYRLQVRPGETIVPSDLEIWLSGRWRAYTVHLGRLLVTPVEHEPWPLHDANLESLEQNLTDSVGLPGLSQPSLVHFSNGVHGVRLGRPVSLSRRRAQDSTNGD